MFYNVPELKPPPLSFPLFIFLSTSHARPHSVVTLLSLILPLFPPLPSRCNASLFWPSLLLLTSVHLPILISSLTSLIICQPSLASLPISLFLHHLPLFCLLPIPLCTFQSTSLSFSLSPSLSSAYVFALAQLSAACSSCTHTPCTHLHIYVHGHDSVEESLCKLQT